LGPTKIRRPVQDRRAERELFFWTLERALKVIALGTGTAYAVASLIEGHLPGAELLSRILG
jgi:hypothetical protein